MIHVITYELDLKSSEGGFDWIAGDLCSILQLGYKKKLSSITTRTYKRAKTNGRRQRKTASILKRPFQIMIVQFSSFLQH